MNVLVPAEGDRAGSDFSGKSTFDVLPCTVCSEAEVLLAAVAMVWCQRRAKECDAREHRLSPFYHHHSHEA